MPKGPEHIAPTADISPARLALVATTTSNMVLILDGEARIEWVNGAFEAHTGYSLADIRGKKPFDLLPGTGTDKETVARMRKRVLDNLTTTFKSDYAKTVTLEGMLEKDAVLQYRQMRTGEKYLVTPHG